MQPIRLAPHTLRVKTKIVATVGPACEDEERLEQMMLAGADVFRLNFSHGTWDWHSAVVERIRSVSQRLGRQVAILQDLCGPKLRLGEIPGGALQCHLGARVRLVSQAVGLGNELPVGDPAVLEALRPGDRVLLADGNVALEVTERHPDAVEAEVTLAGEVRSRQGIAAPNVRLNVEPLTPKDLQDLDWTSRNVVDYVGLSFVRRPEDVDRLRQELSLRGIQANVIAKIEKTEALNHLQAVIQRADAVMVARGDLGIEIDVARVPLVQKEIIRECNRQGKPVITATQMLESMRSSNRPTRAEAADVANAILDGTDAVMLSAETATGLYPIAAVETMNRIAAATESALANWKLPRCPEEEATNVVTSTVICAGQLADRIHARLIVAATRSGETALALSRERNRTPILGLSDNPATVRRMALYWGVLPVHLDEPRKEAEYIGKVASWAKNQGLVSPGDRIVFVLGQGWMESSYNTIMVHEVVG
ncbi:MAG: pyruvate kinase [Gemmatales bacterium]|nr:pyruvate kinase [Gemmatales bacterium]MDW8388231.1 pyruvate kinase [Gemmatales bacterium]